MNEVNGSYIPDFSKPVWNSYPDDGFEYLAVGWLGNFVPREGETAPEVLAALQRCKEQNKLPDAWLGWHDCEICQAEGREPESDSSEFFVQHRQTRYVLPNMVMHYITSHHYCLPELVEKALAQNQPNLNSHFGQKCSLR